MGKIIKSTFLTFGYNDLYGYIRQIQILKL